eukprot:5909714-Amphidinium_carterae.2
MQGKFQHKLNQERTKLHKKAQQRQQQLENELVKYQKRLDAKAEKAVKDRLQQKMGKAKAKMSN